MTVRASIKPTPSGKTIRKTSTGKYISLGGGQRVWKTATIAHNIEENLRFLFEAIHKLEGFLNRIL